MNTVPVHYLHNIYEYFFTTSAHSHTLKHFFKKLLIFYLYFQNVHPYFKASPSPTSSSSPSPSLAPYCSSFTIRTTL